MLGHRTEELTLSVNKIMYLNEETNEYYKNPEFNGEPFGLLQENGESCQYEDEDA